MILGAGFHDRPLLGPTTHAPHDVPREPPRPDPPVQGVVVNPPRDTRVAVRVEIVTEPQNRDPRDEHTAPQPAPAYDAYRSASFFAAAAAGTQPSAAHFGPDARSAASAYRAHAEWRTEAAAGGSDAAARRLSVRA